MTEGEVKEKVKAGLFRRLWSKLLGRKTEDELEQERLRRLEFEERER